MNPQQPLDVTVQKEIIQLLKDIQQETGMSIIFISHDLSLVRDCPSGFSDVPGELWSREVKQIL
jgi:ABC-type microcin C transport system duplicated ATPase subunit YejF